MDIPFELHIALRYLLAKRKQAFISVISLISTLGVTVGVMAVVIALAVMTGLQQELRDRILGSNPHVYVSRVGGIDDYRAEAEPSARGAATSSARRRRSSARRSISAGRGASARSDQGHRSRARAERHRHAARHADGEPGRRSSTAGTPFRASCSARIWRASLGVAVGDSVQVLTLEGALSPMGNRPLPRRRQVVGTLQPRPVRVRLDLRAGVARTSRSGCSTSRRCDFIQLRVDDIYRRAAGRGGRQGAARRPVLDRGLDGDEPVALLGADAREDRRLARRSASS